MFISYFSLFFLNSGCRFPSLLHFLKNAIHISDDILVCFSKILLTPDISGVILALFLHRKTVSFLMGPVSSFLLQLFHRREELKSRSLENVGHFSLLFAKLMHL